jgi:glutamine---fructose-6-phosphate transaminase (isomerizing)
MCGIFGYIGPNKRAAKLVLEGLVRLEYRGYDSWGVAVVPSAGIEIRIKKQVGKIGGASVASLPSGTRAIGHTRWATHGGVTHENAHPHLDCTGGIALIHNGIVENYLSLRAQLQNTGHVFVSDTDSEVIVHLIEEYAKTHLFLDAVHNAFKELAGLNAIIAINTQDDVLIAARNGSPLVIGFGTDENYLASDPAALLPYTKEVYFLEDHDIAIVTDRVVEIRDSVTGKEKTAKSQTLDWDVSATEKGDYSTYMLKEIYEQPDMLAAIAASASTHTLDIARNIQNACEVFLIGCGTSSYVALISQYLFSTIANLHVTATAGSEFSYNLKFLTSDSVVIALSQSGETMDILQPLKKAKDRGAKIISLVNVLGSSLYRASDEQILLTAGPERAVASTKACTAKIAHILLIAFAMADRFEEGQALVRIAAQATKVVLSKHSVDSIRTLTARLADCEDIYCLGRGISYPVSLEAALKIKEISYIHAEGLATGELKHGVLALIEKGTPCIVFLPNDETYQANLSGAMEVKARGGYIIGVSFKPHDVFDSYIHVPDVKEATVIPNIVVAQLISYNLSISRGIDPDMPRNLAKSVTVQ